MIVCELIENLEKQAKEHYDFSQGLFENGDHPNAHYQEGFSKGLEYVIKILKENQQEQMNTIKIKRMEWALTVLKNRTSLYPEFDAFHYIAKQGLGEERSPLDYKK